jgi:hypothetical protein
MTNNWQESAWFELWLAMARGEHFEAEFTISLSE